MKKLILTLTAAMAGAFVFSSGASAAVVAITQNKALAGGITPGDGPGFPVTLSLSGTYQLSTNLQAPAGVNAIDATAVDTTINLNGFKIDGGGVATVGIFSTQRSLTVRNGTVRGFTSVGIAGAGALDTIENMRIEGNGSDGLAFNALGFARIVNNVIFGNGGSGIFCSKACHIEGNLISNNALAGVNLSSFGGFVLGNTIFGNAGSGIFTTSNTAVGTNMLSSNANPQIGGGGPKSLGTNLCNATAC